MYLWQQREVQHPKAVIVHICKIHAFYFMLQNEYALCFGTDNYAMNNISRHPRNLFKAIQAYNNPHR